MKNATFTISIPVPCNESWAAMTLVEQGRFCQNCQKTVTDFSMMSDQEIISFFSKTQGKACGRFHTGQLNREISMPDNARKRPLISLATMLTAITVIIPSIQAKSKPDQIQTTPCRSDVTTPPKQLDTLPRITGIVRDNNDIAVPAVLIKIKEHGQSTRTDMEGKFSLQLPSGFMEKTVTLQVESIGFMTKEVVVTLTYNADMRAIPVQNIKLEQIISGEFVGGPQSKTTLWQRFKYKVERLLH